ncbi:TetR/AcrR family transcriptional regulator [Shewanella maritima]|uniref:TetR/AcrR family transcriptional regulator n=1 Tax=Shewanella maritima TaxID=2520507 RepID=A0A411PLN2_9GAMM|nr:TetR/AcrR family transcriptional regulator [Shewanella maritima]QBF84442.1 TetR/AcrR family transcriptional regulator [Shewanella maritima]
MNDKQYHHGDLKASLIRIANEILQRDGVEGLSLRAIAAEAGVSHMAPYAHFKNKQALLSSIVEVGFIDMAAAMQASTGNLDKTLPENTKTLVLEYGASYLEFATKHPQLYRLMLGQAEHIEMQSQSEDEQASYRYNLNKPFNLLRDAFALQSDDKAQVKAQALGAWSMVHGMAALLAQGRIQLPQGVDLKAFLATASTITFAL